MIMDLTIIQFMVNSSNSHLRLRTSISSCKVKPDLIILQNSLFHNIIEKGMESIGSHFGESETNYSIEIGL